ncbi:MAG: hypothetical protein WDN44_00900 [Sphingomonas sp.]
MSDADRQARLAEALRANLRKRKAQARETQDAESPARDEERDAEPPADRP